MKLGSNTSAAPVPAWFCVNSAGASLDSLMLNAELDAVDVWTITGVSVLGEVGMVTSKGIIALIWLGETYTSGAGTPPTVTETPFSWIGKGLLLAERAEGASDVPKIETQVPGATAPLYDAPLKMP